MTDTDFNGGDLSGRIVDRRFEVVDKLGEGGMGAIYRAKQLSVNRMVALKLLLRDRRGDPISAGALTQRAISLLACGIPMRLSFMISGRLTTVFCTSQWNCWRVRI